VVGRLEAYPSEAFSSLGKAMALSSNVRANWKILPGANTLTCYKAIVNYGHKKFYNISSWPLDDVLVRLLGRLVEPISPAMVALSRPALCLNGKNRE
jgi:hypothetical protein